MKFKWDKKYLHWGVTGFIVIACALIFYMIISGQTSVGDFLGYVFSAFLPVILGFVFAYLLNPLVKILHFNVFDKLGYKILKNEEKSKKIGYAIALVLTVILVVTFFSALLYIVIPRLYKSIETIAGNISEYSTKLKDWIVGLFDSNSEIREMVIKALNDASSKIQSWLNNDLLSELSGIINSVIGGMVTFVESFIKVFVGFIIAIYLLAEKDKLLAQGKKLLYAFSSTEKATAFLNRMKQVNKIFIGFVSGKVIDSVVIGIVCYIGMLIMNIPNAELVSVIIGVTNIIPFFGPFIGGIPSAFLILLDSPIKALIFVIFIIVIMQVDSNIISPKVLGDSTGLSGLWVLCSIMVFGGLFGFVGMLIGVPTFAVIYMLIKENMVLRLKKKSISSDTEEFKKIDYIDPETGKPVEKQQETHKWFKSKAPADKEK